MTLRAADNPFRSERVEGLAYRAPGFSWPALLARLRSQGGRGAIRGPEGSGKTTLLHELGARLATDGYEVRYLRPDLDDRDRATRELRGFPVGCHAKTALLLDGADRVGALEWRRLRRAARRAGVLVVTTHRGGRLPTLHRCATSAELLESLIGELDGARAVACDELYSASDGNMRLALAALYDEATLR